LQLASHKGGRHSMWCTGKLVCLALAVALNLVSTIAFTPSALPTCRSLSQQTRGLQLSMSGQEQLNRQARRQMAKQDKKAKNAKAPKGAAAFNEVQPRVNFPS